MMFPARTLESASPFAHACVLLSLRAQKMYADAHVCAHVCLDGRRRARGRFIVHVRARAFRGLASELLFRGRPPMVACLGYAPSSTGCRFLTLCY